MSFNINANNIAVYGSLDNVNYTKIQDWKLFVKDSGELVISLNTPVTARFIKIKSLFDDRNKDFASVNKAQFANWVDEIIKVYYSVSVREEEYSYDLAGNRLTERVKQRYTDFKNYSYYPNYNQLMSNGKYRFTYDANGNMIKKESMIEGNNEHWDYEYDLFNRLVRVSKSDVAVVDVYVYDDSGLRLKKEGSTKIYYVFGIGGELLYEEENGEYFEYVYIFGKHFARVDGNVTNPETKTYFYQTDHLGSAVLVTDAEGNTIWSSEYTPFGKIAVEEGFLEKAAKFTGKDLDEDTELYYFNARWYDQEIGRFISADPLQDGLNWYIYCNNQPVINIDPLGLKVEYGLNENYQMYAQPYDGDGLGIISQEFYGTAKYVDQLAKDNHISDKNKVQAGQTIILGHYTPESRLIHASLLKESFFFGDLNYDSLKKYSELYNLPEAMEFLPEEIAVIQAIMASANQMREDGQITWEEYGQIWNHYGRFTFVGDFSGAIPSGDEFMLVGGIIGLGRIVAVKGITWAALKEVGKEYVEDYVFDTSLGIVAKGSEVLLGGDYSKLPKNGGVNLRKYDVGIYNEIKGVSGLDAHHVGQKALMRELIPGYNPDLAPCILVPKVGHTLRGPNGIVIRSTNGITNPRQLIARDIMELRRVYPDIPNTQLQKLIDLNKKLYPILRK